MVIISDILTSLGLAKWSLSDGLVGGGAALSSLNELGKHWMLVLLITYHAYIRLIMFKIVIPV